MPKSSKGKDDLEIRRRDQLYRLIISQLFYDGFKEPAFKLCEIFKPHPTCPPSDRLLQITQLSLQLEEERNEKTKGNAIAPASGIDLEFETEVQSISAEAALYETCYVTAHKAACRAATFHHSGQLIATGSEDASIKILDVERMLAKSATPPELIAMETPQQQMENHPVIRTLYDHNDEISCLDFHPTEQILASGSKDYTVKLFEYSKPSVKKAYKSIQEVQPIRCLSFHPSGDFLLVGVNHPTLRLYDVNTFQSYVANDPIFQHSAPVTDVKWCPSGKMFVTCGKDGDIKLYDGVSLKCFNTFKNAHDSKEVTSVVFSKNSKYVLSSGKDSLVKLWELSTNRCLIVYTGAGATGRMDHRTRATFNHTEDYVLFPDEKTTSLCCWDSRNAERQRLLGLGHNGVVRSIVHSPTGPAFMSCSDDCRARFWYRKATAD